MAGIHSSRGPISLRTSEGGSGVRPTKIKSLMINDEVGRCGFVGGCPVMLHPDHMVLSLSLLREQQEGGGWWQTLLVTALSGAAT
jgi:hypothetical protein